MFKTDGVLRLVSLPPMPILKATVSAKAYFGLWQLVQLTDESLESIFSENNFLPNATLDLISTSLFSKNELAVSIVITAAIHKSVIFLINSNLHRVV